MTGLRSCHSVPSLQSCGPGSPDPEGCRSPLTSPARRPAVPRVGTLCLGDAHVNISSVLTSSYLCTCGLLVGGLSSLQPLCLHSEKPQIIPTFPTPDNGGGGVLPLGILRAPVPSHWRAGHTSRKLLRRPFSDPYSDELLALSHISQSHVMIS